jgi:hypothetical protein
MEHSFLLKHVEGLCEQEGIDTKGLLHVDVWSNPHWDSVDVIFTMRPYVKDHINQTDYPMRLHTCWKYGFRVGIDNRFIRENNIYAIDAVLSRGIKCIKNTLETIGYHPVKYDRKIGVVSHGKVYKRPQSILIDDKGKVTVLDTFLQA